MIKKLKNNSIYVHDTSKLLILYLTKNNFGYFKNLNFYERAINFLFSSKSAAFINEYKTCFVGKRYHKKIKYDFSDEFNFAKKYSIPKEFILTRRKSRSTCLPLDLIKFMNNVIFKEIPINYIFYLVLLTSYLLHNNHFNK